MNNLIKFTSYPKPKPGECFSSLIQRISELNCENPLQVIKYLSGTSNFKMRKLDSTPIDRIDLEKFSYLANLRPEDISATMLKSILSKLNLEQMSHNTDVSSFLLNFLEHSRKFCPYCIGLNKYYKLIWQIKDIHFCKEHYIKLENTCPCCKNPISILSEKTRVGFCEYCNFNLTDTPPLKYQASQIDLNYLSLWETLLDSDNNLKFNIHNLSMHKYIALNITRLLENEQYEDYFSLNYKKYNIYYYDIYKLLLALDGKNSWTYLSTLFSTLFLLMSKNGYILSDIEKIPYQTLTKNSITNILEKIKTTVSCRAPFCENYNKKGSLTYFDNHPRIAPFKEPCYFLYCSSCGISYYYIISDGTLVERGSDFLGEGYLTLNEFLLKSIDLENIPLPTAKLNKYMHYFVSCNLLPPRIMDFYKVKKYDKDVISAALNYYKRVKYTSKPEFPIEIKYYKDILIAKQVERINYTRW